MQLEPHNYARLRASLGTLDCNEGSEAVNSFLTDFSHFFWGRKEMRTKE